MFNSLGTATNSAVQRYLNDKKVPQLFVVSGAAKFADPKNFPWTIPGVVAYETEGGAYAKHILQTKPDGKIAILSQNDEFGRDFVAGFKRALGNKAVAMIVAETTYENGEPTINSQVAALKATGANILLSVTLGKYTSQMIRGVADIGWKPEVTYVPQSSSSIAFLEPAGLENAVGLVSNVSQKDVNDDQWTNDEDVKEYFALMKQFLPSGDPHNVLYSLGYMNGHLLVQVLKACGDDLSRENIMRQATSLHKLKLPLLLPGVSISTAPDDYLPIKQLQLRRFNGKNWIGIGNPIEDEVLGLRYDIATENALVIGATLMAVQALGYIGIGIQNIDDWSDFATSQLGLQWLTERLRAAPSAWTIVASGSSLIRTARMRRTLFRMGGRGCREHGCAGRQA